MGKRGRKRNEGRKPSSEEDSDYAECVEELENRIEEMEELTVVAAAWAEKVEGSKDKAQLHEDIKGWITQLKTKLASAQVFMKEKKTFIVTDNFRMELADHMADSAFPRYETFRHSVRCMDATIDLDDEDSQRTMIMGEGGRRYARRASTTARMSMRPRT